MRHHRAFALLTILFTCIGLSAAQTIRYFKADGVGETYVKLGTDGSSVHVQTTAAENEMPPQYQETRGRQLGVPIMHE